MKVLVIGGAGFIGRAVVAALSARGATITIGTRRPRRPRRNRAAPRGVQLESVELHRLIEADDWLARIAPFDVVVNCAGILRERWGESFDAVYRLAPMALAEACIRLDKRFIHVTALGLSLDATSGFISAKLAGERGIAAMGGLACIVRPSLINGLDGFGSRWIARVAQWPVLGVPADAVGQLAPLNVGDLGEAIAALCACPRERLPKSVELGGETRYRMAQYLRALRRNTRPAITFSVPGSLVRLAAHVFDVLHVTPLSWGHVELMRCDNVPREEDRFALRHWIGRAPVPVES